MKQAPIVDVKHVSILGSSLGARFANKLAINAFSLTSQEISSDSQKVTNECLNSGRS